MPERYAVIPECPDDEDLKPLADVMCEAMGLPQDDAHPRSVDLAAGHVVAAYRAIYNRFGRPLDE